MKDHARTSSPRSAVMEESSIKKSQSIPQPTDRKDSNNDKLNTHSNPNPKQSTDQVNEQPASEQTADDNNHKDGDNASTKNRILKWAKYNKLIEKLSDPAMSTTACFTMFTASAAAAYLSYQHKHGRSSKIVAAGVTVGVAALGLAEFFSIKAYIRTNKLKP